MRMKSKSSQGSPSQGGARDGAGRPSQGKTRVNLTLNEQLVEQARGKAGNLSALLDRLLMEWLKTSRP